MNYHWHDRAALVSTNPHHFSSMSQDLGIKDMILLDFKSINFANIRANFYEV